MLEKRTIGTDDADEILVRYVYSNHLQSASLELDGAANIISYEEYHPYGTTAFQAKSATNNAVAKRYRYTGKERDDESGLYYHGARYYIPWLARWTAIDPMESKYAGMSPYNYSFNNPIMWNDLSGMQPGDGDKRNTETPKSGFFETRNDDGSLSGVPLVEGLDEFVVKANASVIVDPSISVTSGTVDNDLAQYAISPKYIEGLLNRQQKKAYSIDINNFNFKPQATISKGSPYNAEYQTYLSNQAWLTREMAARRELDPIGFGLAESPGVQFGMDLVMPSYGVLMSGMQVYSGVRNDNKFEVIMGSIGLGLSAFGAYRNFANKQKVIQDSKVEVMGGPNPKLEAGYINYDINTPVGIEDDVANFSNHFAKESVDAIQVNNPQASFLEEVYSSLRPGAIVTVRGTYSNAFFKKIWLGKAAGMDNFNVIKLTDEVPNLGYLQTTGEQIKGTIKEIILQKNKFYE